MTTLLHLNAFKRRKHLNICLIWMHWDVLKCDGCVTYLSPRSTPGVESDRYLRYIRGWFNVQLANPPAGKPLGVVLTSMLPSPRMPTLGASSDGGCLMRLATSALIKKFVSKFLHASQMRRYIHSITNDGKLESLLTAHVADNTLAIMDADSMLYFRLPLLYPNLCH